MKFRKNDRARVVKRGLRSSGKLGTVISAYSNYVELLLDDVGTTLVFRKDSLSKVYPIEAKTKRVNKTFEDLGVNIGDKITFKHPRLGKLEDKVKKIYGEFLKLELSSIIVHVSQYVDHYRDVRVGEKYILWSPQSDKPPRVVHGDYESACQARDNMAKKYKGQEFYVMKAVSMRVLERKVITEYVEKTTTY